MHALDLAVEIDLATAVVDHVCRRGLDGFGLIVDVHVRLFLLAHHGERTQRAEHEGNDRDLVTEVLDELLDGVDVPHHAVAGMVIDVLDLLVVVDVLVELVIVVGMRRLVFGVDELLAPCCALDRQADQRDDAVEVEFLLRLDVGLGAEVGVHRPVGITAVDEPASAPGDNRIVGDAIGLLVIECLATRSMQFM